ncbi:hypothetical protein BZG83_14400 [Salinivibrio sp. PR919]|nr:hypothetical protein BZG83_14400 [Salinivibrio sp. PR919]OOF19042.1 hypothetical protein BZG84_02255 [Salinivibrio sp. PR932]
MTKRLNRQIEDLMDITASTVLSRFLGQSGAGPIVELSLMNGLYQTLNTLAQISSVIFELSAFKLGRIIHYIQKFPSATP